MSSHYAVRTILGSLCFLVVGGCGDEVPSQRTSAEHETVSAWTGGVVLDGRLRGLVTESHGQLTPTDHGFASRLDRRRPLTVRLAERADGIREVRAAGASRLSLRVESLGARGVTGELDQGRITYRQAFPSTDVVSLSTTSLYEELWVLRDEDAPQTFRWQLTPGAGLTGPIREVDGTASYVDARGRAVLRIGEPYAIDAAGTRHPVEVQWRADGREVIFRLDHRGLPHPVVVDPPITAVPRWKEIILSDAPAGRSAAGMTYWAANGAVVMFGGLVCGPPCLFIRDLWRYDGAAWTIITPTATSSLPGLVHTAFFADEGNVRLRLYGGWTGSVASGTEWIFAPAAWTMLLANGTAGHREGASAVWNANESRPVLFGGQNESELKDGTYESAAGSTPFVLTSDTAQPPMRRDHRMVYDAGDQRVLLFGGRGCVRGEVCPPYSDVWQRVAGAWTVVPTTGTSPAARWGHHMAYDAARGVTVVFGGRDETTAFGDTYELSGDAWTQTVASGEGPPARGHGVMAYDGTRGVTVLFGGTADPIEPETATAQLGDTWEYAPIDLSCTTGAVTRDSVWMGHAAMSRAAVPARAARRTKPRGAAPP